MFGRQTTQAGRQRKADRARPDQVDSIRRLSSLLRRLAVASLAACAIATAPAMAAGKDNSLRVADDQVLDNADPYFNNVRIGVILSQQVWDTLIYRGPKSNEYKGQLATSWKWIDQKTLELELRKGVKFHNGASFDADDVDPEFRLQAGEQGDDAEQRRLDRSCGKARALSRSHRDETAVSGGDRVSGRPDRHPSARVL